MLGIELLVLWKSSQGFSQLSCLSSPWLLFVVVVVAVGKAFREPLEHAVQLLGKGGNLMETDLLTHWQISLVWLCSSTVWDPFTKLTGGC